VAVIRTLLDRELCWTGLVHDLRGPVTALGGLLELEPVASPLLQAACERLSAMVAEDLPSRGDHVEDLAVLLGVPGSAPAVMAAPGEVLAQALLAVRHDGVAVSAGEHGVIVEITGVATIDGESGWSLGQVRAWLADGAPGLAGARMRVAARLCGAQAQVFTAEPGAAHGLLRLHFARAG
jgi:hypothetical protein